MVAFDEVLAPARAAIITLQVELQDPTGRRLLEREFSVEEPVVGTSSDAFATAMGKALDRSTAKVAHAVTATLR